MLARVGETHQRFHSAHGGGCGAPILGADGCAGAEFQRDTPGLGLVHQRLVSILARGLLVPRLCFALAHLPNSRESWAFLTHLLHCFGVLTAAHQPQQQFQGGI